MTTERDIIVILETIDNNLSKRLDYKNQKVDLYYIFKAYNLSDPINNFINSLCSLNWSSDKARSEGLRKIAIAQIGTDKINETLFTNMIGIEFVKQILPLILEKVKYLNIKADCNIYNINEAQYLINYIKDEAEKLVVYYRNMAHNNKNEYIENTIKAKDCEIVHSICHFLSPISLIFFYNVMNKTIEIFYNLEESDVILKTFCDIILKTLEELKSPGCKWSYLYNGNYNRNMFGSTFF